MKDVLLVAAGGAIGAVARYGFGGWVAARLGPDFPWHTLVVNLTGAFLLGLVMALSLDKGAVTASWRLFLGTGILGGYTTFSTLSFESVALIEQGLWAHGLGNMAASALGGIVAVVLGLALGRAV